MRMAAAAVPEIENEKAEYASIFRFLLPYRYASGLAQRMNFGNPLENLPEFSGTSEYQAFPVFRVSISFFS